jgi:hypothetical protein
MERSTDVTVNDEGGVISPARPPIGHRRITGDSLDEMRERADAARHSGSVGDLFQLAEDLTDIVQAVIDGNGHIDLAGGYARLGR